jgi:hypothetical protein
MISGASGSSAVPDHPTDRSEIGPYLGGLPGYRPDSRYKLRLAGTLPGVGRFLRKRHPLWPCGERPD